MARRRKASPPPPLHELEADIVESLWASGEMTVREVMDELNAQSSPERAYTTS
jgi:predicted transcriptional regulator